MRRYGSILPAMLVLLVTAACAAPAAALPEEPAFGETEAPSGNPADAALTGAGDVVAPAPAAASSFYDLEPGLSERTTRGRVWAEPVIDGDSVAISLSVARLGDHVSFEVPAGDGVAVFLGYFVQDEFLVRATVCPSCGEERIEWGGSLLACRACDTTFDAVTGEADEGDGGYPAGVLPCSIEDGLITMSLGDLLTAYNRTATGEETLFEQPEVVEDDDRGDRSWPRCCTR